MAILKNKKALAFVILLGFISLFADMTYESARSINGQYLQILGTTGFTVGWVAGVGELLGYSLRWVSGYFADRTKRYWIITLFGYTLNLISVPLLALAGYWQLAVLLMILERVGKAVRVPPRDAMLSFGASKIGRGFGYGLNELLDQTGATIGPLIVAGILFEHHNSYKTAYSYLAIPAVIAIIILVVSMRLYPHPDNLEIQNKSLSTTGYPKLFWLFVFSVSFIALGFADFPLIAFHFKNKMIIEDAMIPVYYAIAMATDGLVALLLGKLFDNIGMKTLVLASIVASAFAPLVFLGGKISALIGVITWGIGMGAQESVVKALIAEMTPPEKRGKSFGLFYTVFGTFWFVGSVIMGRLYDCSIPALIYFSVITQLIAVLLLFLFVNNKQLNQLKIKSH